METKKPGLLYKTLSTVSTVGLFFTVGLLVTSLFNGFLSAVSALILVIFTIIFAGCMLSLVWINNIENKRFKKTSILFLSFTIFCCLLWIISAILIYVALKKAALDANYYPSGILQFVKIAFIISVQFVVSNIIARNLIKYKKTYIAFQIVMYISALFVDFYVAMLAVGIKFIPEKGMEISESIRSFLFSPGMITTFILFVIYIAIANSVLNGIQTKRNNGTKTTRRRLLGKLIENLEEGQFDEVENYEPLEKPIVDEDNIESAEERLIKLKKLYESNLITEDEFNLKKKEILEDM